MKNIKIKFLGGTKQIGKSAILVDNGKKKILLDYGTYPGKEPEFPPMVNPKDIDAIVLSHAHLDHSGAIPMLYRNAVSPPLITTFPTLELADLLIRDMIKLAKGKVPFSIDSLQRMRRAFVPAEYGEPIELDRSTSITLYNAGHIPGSASILIEMDGTRIWYTGDINTIKTRLLEPATLVDDVDILIIESTYATRRHPDRSEEEKRFLKRIHEILDNNGTVLVPAFSVGRSQEVMCILEHHMFRKPTALDGMAQAATGIIMGFPEYIRNYKILRRSIKRVKWMATKSQRKKMLRKPGLVISPAGMLNGGWSIWYLKQVYKNNKDGIFFVSYQVPGTLGHKIVNSKSFTIGNKETKVEAHVDYFELSSHTDNQGLHKIVGKAGASKVFVVHGDEDSTEQFVKELVDMGIDTYAPRMEEEFVI